MNYKQLEVPGGVPVKMWTQGVPVEIEAQQQLENAARLPIVFKHIAAMPDVHYGIGATVGSVISTYKAIIPAAVGVDIGCGMIACKTSLRAEDLPDNLARLRSEIEKPCRTGCHPSSFAVMAPTVTKAPGKRRPMKRMPHGRNWSMSLTRFARRTCA